MTNFIRSILFILVLTLFASCANNRQVYNDSDFNKRKYRDGTYVQKRDVKKEKPNELKHKMEVHEKASKHDSIVEEIHSYLDNVFADSSEEFILEDLDVVSLSSEQGNNLPASFTPRQKKKIERAKKRLNKRFSNPKKELPRHRLAMLGFLTSVFGLLALFVAPLVGIPFIIYGMITSASALKRMNAEPGKNKGDGLARVGLTIGISFVIIALIVLLIILLIFARYG